MSDIYATMSAYYWAHGELIRWYGLRHVEPSMLPFRDRFSERLDYHCATGRTCKISTEWSE